MTLALISYVAAVVLIGVADLALLALARLWMFLTGPRWSLRRQKREREQRRAFRRRKWPHRCPGCRTRTPHGERCIMCARKTSP